MRSVSPIGAGPSAGAPGAAPTTALVAPDSFKGTISAPEASEALARGIEAVGLLPDRCPVGDGGEGTTEVLADALGGTTQTSVVSDPVGRPHQANFVVREDEGTAMLDVASASGLVLLADIGLDPLRASTAGTGELVLAAAETGAREIIVAAGGSATTDGGQGALDAIAAGGGLRGARLTVLCDTHTTFEDAALIFGPQKGAGAEEVEALTERLHSQALRMPRDPRGIAMTGCAGGLAGALWAVCDAELRSGANYVLEAIGFRARARRAAFVVTGEGALDHQSSLGKIVGEISAVCSELDRPLHAVAGRNDLGGAGMDLELASIDIARDVDELCAVGRKLALRYADLTAVGDVTG